MALLTPFKQLMDPSTRFGRTSNQHRLRHFFWTSPLVWGIGGVASTLLLSACGRIPSAVATLKNNALSDNVVEDNAIEDSSRFDLLPGFQPDPAIGRGESGGTIAASELIDSGSDGAKACEGYIPESPNHQVHLREDFGYLRIAVESHSPTALAIVADNGGSWCNTGKFPSVEQEFWPEGLYDIYVGNPEVPEPGDRYELSISEVNPQLEAEWDAGGDESFTGQDYQAISVAPGFEPDPTVGTGNVGGPLLASDVMGTKETETGDCQGYIDSEADHYLTIEHPFQYLKVLAESDSPTSLAILGPQGEAWCHTGSNPYIEGVWDAGEYQVYLANLEEADVGDRYELLVTEID